MDRIPCMFSSTLRETPSLLPVVYPGATPGVTLLPVVSMSLNPRSVSWQQPKRITTVYTRGGAKFFHWTDSAGRNQDILTLRFEGSTGNISRKISEMILGFDRPPAVQASEPLMPPDNYARLLLWTNLYQLTREPVRLPDGTFNWQYIQFTSLTVPSMIRVQGHYEAVMEFSEDAQDASRARYSFSFVVAPETEASQVDQLLTLLQQAR
jgi:hypothetical protein